MASDLLLVVDDNSGNFTFSGGWAANSLVQWYGGTSRQLQEGNYPDQAGSFSFDFEGTSAAFFGVTPSPSALQNITVSIDGAAPTTSGFGDPALRSYRQWYQSPELLDGEHTIAISGVEGISIDYAVVRASSSTSLRDKRVIVDDDDPSVRYSGNWVRNGDEFKAGHIPSGTPFQNGTHRSWVVGDKFSFDFTGSSVAVYGIFSWDLLGLLSATYTLDGTSLSQTYSVTASSPEYLNNVGEAPNFLFYSMDRLSPGEHKLDIEITHSDNQSFILDFITYSPSFDSISRVPAPSISSSSSKPLTTTSGSNGRIYNPKTSSTPESNFESTGEKISPEAIVGIVVGALAFLALIGIFIFCILRRRVKKGHRKCASDDYSRPLISEKLPPVRRSFLNRLSLGPYRPTITPYMQTHTNWTSQAPQTAQQRTFSQSPELRSHEPRAQARPVIPPILTNSASRPAFGPASSALAPPTDGVTNTLQPQTRFAPLRRGAGAPSSAGRKLGLASGLVPAAPAGARPRMGDTIRPATSADSLTRSQENCARSASYHSTYTARPGGFGSSTTSIPVRRGFSESSSSRDAPAVQIHHAYQLLQSSGMTSVSEASPRGVRREAETQQTVQPYQRPPLVLVGMRPADNTPPSTGSVDSQRSQSPPCIDPSLADNAPLSTHTRLTPVRRTFVCEPPASAPASLSRTPSSPLANLFPRLTSIWRRGSRDMPEDVGEDEDDVPPAYHTLSARQSSAISPRSGRPLPSCPL
ncbi:unnamed protein product [Cyclocybe aegerita]|uniref:Uncharacterized protein n=1 Tax=Cyclocybe aegerita TaxID=1973307 RepID=A0A8S0WP88_CYCAE|nr:unnamed protein product [Cyclocybe aegerita]